MTATRAVIAIPSLIFDYQENQNSRLILFGAFRKGYTYDSHIF